MTASRFLHDARRSVFNENEKTGASLDEAGPGTSGPMPLHTARDFGPYTGVITAATSDQITPTVHVSAVPRTADMDSYSHTAGSQTTSRLRRAINGSEEWRQPPTRDGRRRAAARRIRSTRLRTQKRPAPSSPGRRGHPFAAQPTFYRCRTHFAPIMVRAELRRVGAASGAMRDTTGRRAE